MILPAHPKPYFDELLSSWLIRLAHTNGLKVQTFCHLLFPNFEIWNRDIDRHAPDFVIETLAEKTGSTAEQIHATTLNFFQGKLFDNNKLSAQLSWISSLKAHHRKRQHHGIAFCPQCLADDETAYFRKSWRIAMHTFCPIHQIMLHDCCPQCGTYIAFHRQELGKPHIHTFTELKYCWQCEFDLSQSLKETAVFHDSEMATQWAKWLEQFSDPNCVFRQPERDKLKILHRFVVISTSQRLAPNLYAYLCQQTQQTPLNLDRSQKIIWESRRLPERHSTVYACMWLLQNYPYNLIRAWQDKAVQYNHLLKDFRDCPDDFQQMVSQMNRNVHKHLYNQNRDC